MAFIKAVCAHSSHGKVWHTLLEVLCILKFLHSQRIRRLRTMTQKDGG